MPQDSMYKAQNIAGNKTSNKLGLLRLELLKWGKQKKLILGCFKRGDKKTLPKLFK